MYEQAQQQGQGFPGGSYGFGGGAQDAWTINMGGPGGGYRTMSPEEMQDLFGNEDPFSDFFRTFFGGGGRETGGRARGGRAAADAEGAGHRAGVELTLEEAYHGATRRRLDQGRRPRANDGRAYSGRRQGGLAGARGRRRRLREQRRAAGDLYLRVQVKPHAVFERNGSDLQTKVAGAGHDRRPRRRSPGADGHRQRRG